MGTTAPRFQRGLHPASLEPWQGTGSGIRPAADAAETSSAQGRAVLPVGLRPSQVLVPRPGDWAGLSVGDLETCLNPAGVRVLKVRVLVGVCSQNWGLVTGILGAVETPHNGDKDHCRV